MSRKEEKKIYCCMKCI